MPVEIERKFLVNKNLLNITDKGYYICQGYLTNDPSRTVRVRIKDDKGFITIKGKSTGISRLEFEYEIPVEEAKQILSLSVSHPIKKYRHEISHKGNIWEVDIFGGENEGLILAEIELSSEDQTFELPNWIDKEVSEDIRYFNSYLSKNPFKNWDNNLV